METQSVMEMLQGHPFLEGLSEQHLRKLASMAVEARFDRDQVIFREGDESSFFYLLVAGKVALEVPAPGRTIRIQTLGPGEELGWSSVLSPVRKQFQARSLEPVQALAFDGARLLNACEEDCSFGYTLMNRLLQVVAGRLQATRMQLLDVFKPGAKLS